MVIVAPVAPVLVAPAVGGDKKKTMGGVLPATGKYSHFCSWVVVVAAGGEWWCVAVCGGA